MLGDNVITDGLRCTECGTVADGLADGWHAYVAGGFEGEELTLGAFCPDCARQECAPDDEDF